MGDFFFKNIGVNKTTTCYTNADRHSNELLKRWIYYGKQNNRTKD